MPPQLKILVAEDNALNQELILLMLETLGYSATLASNGLQVLAALKESAYDLILMDMQMPRMDGATAARQIQLELGSSRPRIVALTASSSSSRSPDLEDCVDDFVTKPISREALQRVLDGSSTATPIDRPVASAPVTLDLALFEDSAGTEPEFQRHFAAVFQQELDSGMDELSRAVATDGPVPISKLAHSLKGASSSLGAVCLAGLLNKLETCNEWAPESLRARLEVCLQEVIQESNLLRTALLRAFPPLESSAGEPPKTQS